MSSKDAFEADLSAAILKEIDADLVAALGGLAAAGVMTGSVAGFGFGDWCALTLVVETKA
ncbi:MAG: hypothetical protein ACFB0E_17075 [Leptolyngbyaceae cyanobacterium]